MEKKQENAIQDIKSIMRENNLTIEDIGLSLNIWDRDLTHDKTRSASEIKMILHGKVIKLSLNEWVLITACLRIKRNDWMSNIDFYRKEEDFEESNFWFDEVKTIDSILNKIEKQ